MLLPRPRIGLRQFAQRLAKLLFQGLAHRFVILILVDAFARSGRLERRTLDDAADKARPRRQEIALAFTDEHASNEDGQIAELAHRGHRARRHKQEALQRHRDVIVSDIDLPIAQRKDSQRLGIVEGASDVFLSGVNGVFVLPRRIHQVDRMLIPLDIDRRRQKVGVGANGVGQGAFLEDERRGRLDAQLDGGADLIALARRQIVMLIAARVPAQGIAAGDRARRQRHFLGN